MKSENNVEKLLIVQLSDFHTKNVNDGVKESFGAIFKYLKSNYDLPNYHIFFCFTGDIAFSGLTEEYNCFNVYLNKLINSLEKETKLNYDFLFVPGNHDMNFKGVERKREDVIEIKKNITTNVIKGEIDKLKNFYNFSNKHETINLKYKQVESNIVDVGNYKILINRLNSSMFSTLYLKEPCDNSKSLHSFKTQLIEKIGRETNYDFMITLIHHTFSWFNSKTELSLKNNLCKPNSLILTGHEHNQDAQVVKSDVDFILLMSGKYEEGDISFNLVEVNLSKRKTNIDKVIWDLKEKIFKKRSKTIESQNIVQNMKGYIYDLGYVNNLYMDNTIINNGDFIDFYVFPTLSYSTYEEKKVVTKKIFDFEELLSVIKSLKVINFEGAELAGKTTLLKYIHNNLKKENTILYFNAETFENQSVHKVVKSTYEKQFDKVGNSFEYFKQDDTSLKIALIDNFSIIKEYQLNQILKNFLSYFDQIFITTTPSQEFNIKKMLEDMIIDTEQINLKIGKFYYDGREKLIEKTLNILLPDLISREAENLTLKINNYINQNIDIINLAPWHVLLLSKHYIEAYSKEAVLSNSFGKVFEANITKNIVKYFDNDVEQVNMVLSKIAYYIHFNKKYPINHFELTNIIEEYINEYRIKNIDTRLFVESCIRSKILSVKTNNNYIFNSKNYLAYFTAIEIIRKNNDILIFNDDEPYQDLHIIANEISFGINSQILMFMAYLVVDLRYVFYIVERVKEFSNNLIELNLDNLNLPYLRTFEMQKDVLKEKATKEEREKQRKAISTTEENYLESQIIEVEKLYGYDITTVNDFSNTILKIIKLTDIVSSILPRFRHELRPDKQDEILDLLFSLPNKLTYKVFGILSDNFGEFIEELRVMFLNRNQLELSTKELENLVFSFTIFFIISTYYNVIGLALDKNTIDIFLEYDKDTITSEIQKLIIYESIDTSSNMDVLADKMNNVLKKYDKNPIVFSMVRTIFDYHRNRLPNLNLYGKPQAIIDKLFTKTKDKKKLIRSKVKR